MHEFPHDYPVTLGYACQHCGGTEWYCADAISEDCCKSKQAEIQQLHARVPELERIQAHAFALAKANGNSDFSSIPPLLFIENLLAAVRREVEASDVCQFPKCGGARDFELHNGCAGDVNEAMMHNSKRDGFCHVLDCHPFQPEPLLDAVKRALRGEPLPSDTCAYKSPHVGVCPMTRAEHNGPMWKRGYPAHSFIKQAPGWEHE